MKTLRISITLFLFLSITLFLFLSTAHVQPSEIFVNSINMGFVSVQGTDFSMQQTEVTVGQWSEFVNYTGYTTEAEINGGCTVGVWRGGLWYWEQTVGKSWRDPNFYQSDSDPVVCVSWNDANAFAEWLSLKEGRTYRLPTEWEWQTACGQTPTPIRDYAWYLLNSGPTEIPDDAPPEEKDAARPYCHTHPVMTKLPNPNGLYDMTGNVWEWCDNYYDGTTQRALRGGSWWYDSFCIKCDFRSKHYPDYRFAHLGFRVLLENLSPTTSLIDPSIFYEDIEDHVNTVFSNLTEEQKESLNQLYQTVLYLMKKQ